MKIRVFYFKIRRKYAYFIKITRKIRVFYLQKIYAKNTRILYKYAKTPKRKKKKMNNTVLAGTFEVEGPGADGHWRARYGAQNYCASKQRQNGGSECVGCSDLAVHGPPAFV